MEALKTLIRNIALFLFVGMVPSLCWAAGFFAPLSWPSFFLLLACLFCILYIRAISSAQTLKTLLLTRKEEWAILEGDQLIDRSEHFPSSSLSSLISSFSKESVPKLTSAIHLLIKEGVTFQLRIPGRSGGAIFELEGESIQGQSVLWFRDVTKEVLSEKLRVETSQKNEELLHKLQEMFDTVPILLWHRDNQERIDYCNHAYSTAVQTQPSQIYEESVELIGSRTAKTLARKAHNLKSCQNHEGPAVADGERKYFRISEYPDKDGNGTTGIALDISDLNEAKLKTKSIINAHDKVLDHLSTAIAIFDAEGILQYYNQAYVALKGFEEDFLRTKPGLDQILEDMRSRRQIPEYADFPAYKKQLLQQLTEQVEPLEELVHLPDERTIRMFTAPYPLGGLLFMQEDVTDHLALESHNKTLLDAYQTTLDNLFEGVIVLSNDNRLKIYNPSFLKMWYFNLEDIEPDMHISQILEKVKDSLDIDQEWETYKAKVLEHLTNRVPKTGEVKRKDGTIIHYGYVPIPNGDHLLSYTEATTSNYGQAIHVGNHDHDPSNKVIKLVPKKAKK